MASDRSPPSQGASTAIVMVTVFALSILLGLLHVFADLPYELMVVLALILGAAFVLWFRLRANRVGTPR